MQPHSEKDILISMTTNDELLAKMHQLLKRLDSLEKGQEQVRAEMQAGFREGSQNIESVDVKVEAVYEFNEKAHIEIMEALADSNDIHGSQEMWEPCVSGYSYS